MGMGIGMLALQCAVEFEYRWNVRLQNVRLPSNSERSEVSTRARE